LIDQLRDTSLPVVFLGLSGADSPNKWFAAEVAAPAKLLDAQHKLPLHPVAWCLANLPQEESAAPQNVPEGSVELQWLDLVKHGAKLAAPQAALAATAHGMLGWHRSNRVSPVSGLPMEASQGGWALKVSGKERCVHLHGIFRDIASF
jgi:NADH pyrophosphatase NudC (nudix superfamily)